MGYTFEGLTGRTSTNEIGERMHEACFCWIQVLSQEDDIFAWLIYVVICRGIQYGCYIRMVKRRIVLSARLFPEVMLMFLVGKYGRLPAE